MKKNKNLMTGLILATLSLAIGLTTSSTVRAADQVVAEDTGDVSLTVVGGGLDLVNVPNFVFEDVDLNEPATNVERQGKFVDQSPTGISVSDFTGNEGAYELTAQLTELVGKVKIGLKDTDYSLPATLTLEGTTGNFDEDDEEATSPTTYDKVVLGAGGSPVTIMKTQSNIDHGRGHWSYNLSKVNLEIPLVKYAGTFEGVITYTLSAVDPRKAQ